MLIHSAKDLAKFAHTQRKKKSINQSALGAKVGLKQTTISKFEIRPQTTKLDTLFRILSALDMELHIIPKPQKSEP